MRRTESKPQLYTWKTSNCRGKQRHCWQAETQKVYNPHTLWIKEITQEGIPIEWIKGAKEESDLGCVFMYDPAEKKKSLKALKMESIKMRCLENSPTTES